MVDGHEQHSEMRLVVPDWRPHLQIGRHGSSRSLPICKGTSLVVTFVRDLIAILSAMYQGITKADSLQVSVRDLSNWSVGPTFRGYVSNADSYVRIRVDEF